jgi:hypothetical protein
VTSSARDRAVEAGTTEPAPDRDAVAEAVLRRWAFLSDDDSHSTMSLSDAHDLVGVVTRALAEAGTTEPAPDGDSWESITGALVLVGAEQKDTTPGLLALLPIVDRIRALARAGAPSEPDPDHFCAKLLDNHDGTVHICKRPPHGPSTREEPHDDLDGVRWWDGETHTIRAEAGAPAEPTGDTAQEAPDA